MFAQVYKNTHKTIFRSKLFYLALIVVFAISIATAIRGGGGYYLIETQETIYDTDPRFELHMQPYVQNTSNFVTSYLLYIMPAFTVITTVIVMSRDWRDRFFEIEKGADVKASHYLLGRIAALVTVNFAVMMLLPCVQFYIYVFTRGGLYGVSTMDMIADSSIRLMRNIVLEGWPCVLMYMGLTYACGWLFKSGTMGGVCGMSYIVVYFILVSYYRFRLFPFYFDYLSPRPEKLTMFLHYYDSEWHYLSAGREETTWPLALTCVAILLGVALVYFLISYWRTKKREY